MRDNIGTCLNPGQRHRFPWSDPTKRICPEPFCGFLLEGAWLEQWHVISLLRHTPFMDLYAAASTPPERGQYRADMAVRVLQPASSVRLPALRSLQTLTHPHIHPILAIEEIEPGGPLYLRSQFERRGSLAHILKAGTPLSYAFISSIVHQIAEVLHLMHERNIVHGHLKPENCLITTSGVMQVDDFYLALVGSVPGNVPTPFTAPEQLQGGTQPASDQFALATLAYLLLRQCSPLAARKAGEQALVTSSYPLLAASEPLLVPTHPLDRIIRHALSREPAGRFPDIWTFVRYLDSVLEQLTATNTPLPLGPGRSPSALDNQRNMLKGGRSASDLPHPTEQQQRSFPAQAYQRVPGNTAHEQPPRSVELPKGISSTCLLPGHTAAISALCWERNGRALVSGSEDGEIRLWTFQKTIGRLEGVLQGHKGSVRMLSWSPDGTAVASASNDSALRIWNINIPAKGPRQVELSWWGHDGDITALDWAPDGSMLASGGKDGTLRFWNRKGEGLLKIQAHGGKGVRSLAWSPDQSLVATGGTDQQIHIWNVASSQQIASWKAAHQDEVRQLQWSPNGQFLASAAGRKDTRVCLWDAHTGQDLATIVDHQREIAGLFWSNDSFWLATCSTDGMLYFWQTNHLLEKRILERRTMRPIVPPITLSNMPQIMHGLPASDMLAIATRALSIDVFEIINR